MERGDHDLPRPYLNRKATDERLTLLGFDFSSAYVYGSGQPQRFQALQELIAGAIAEWADVKDDFDETGGAHDIDLELQEWAQEWLVG